MKHKIINIVLTCMIFGLASGATVYNVFSPGGDLNSPASTWNTQTVGVGAITDTKGSLSSKPAVTNAADSNITLSGVQTIDGQAGTANLTLTLATAQSTPSQNGPWIQQTGAWTRPAWWPSGGTTQAVQFSTYFVRLGTTYGGTTWRQTTAGPITIDTSSVAFAETKFTLNSSSVQGTLPAANLPSGVPSASANPSAQVGTTAVNGVATTYMTSDSSPPLNLGITPTWTGSPWTWSNTEPRLITIASGGGANGKNWDFDFNPTVLNFRTRTDADGAGVNYFTITRQANSTTITSINFGSGTGNPTYTFLGTGTVSFNSSSQVTLSSINTGGNFGVTGTTRPTVGIYRQAAGVLGFACGSASPCGNIDSTGNLIFTNGLLTEGTKFTATGCSNSATVGGVTAGQFASGTTGVCTVTITLPTAPNGWSCAASDLTTPANLISQNASAVNSCTITGTTVTADVIHFLAIGY